MKKQIKNVDTKDGEISINAKRAEYFRLRIPPQLYDSSRIKW